MSLPPVSTHRRIRVRADPERTDLVFAAQAKVPAAREDRVRLLGWLVDAARRRPSRRVVVKVRARRGEAQTHDEAYDFAELLDDPAVREELGGSLPRTSSSRTARWPSTSSGPRRS